MLAAANAAQYGHPAPEDLQDAWDCQRYNIPFDGSDLMSQPAGKTLRMNIALNVYNSFESRQRAILHDIPMDEWSQNNPQAWKIVAHIERMRFDNRS
jgi:hypothetical protein